MDAHAAAAAAAAAAASGFCGGGGGGVGPDRLVMTPSLADTAGGWPLRVGYCRTASIVPSHPLHLDLASTGGAAAAGPGGPLAMTSGWPGAFGPLVAHCPSLLRSPVSPYSELFSPSTAAGYPVGPLGAAASGAGGGTGTAAGGWGRTLTASPATDRFHSPLWSPPPPSGLNVYGGLNEGGSMSYYSSSPTASYLYMSLLANAAAATAAAAAAAANGCGQVPASPFPSPSSGGSCTPACRMDMSPLDLPSPVAYHHRIVDIQKGFHGPMLSDFSPPLPVALTPSQRQRHLSSPADRHSDVTGASVTSFPVSRQNGVHGVVKQEVSLCRPVKLDVDDGQSSSSRRRRRHGQSVEPSSRHRSDDSDIYRTQKERDSLGLRDNLSQLRLVDQKHDDVTSLGGCPSSSSAEDRHDVDARRHERRVPDEQSPVGAASATRADRKTDENCSRSAAAAASGTGVELVTSVVDGNDDEDVDVCGGADDVDGQTDADRSRDLNENQLIRPSSQPQPVKTDDVVKLEPTVYDSVSPPVISSAPQGVVVPMPRQSVVYHVTDSRRSSVGVHQTGSKVHAVTFLPEVGRPTDSTTSAVKATTRSPDRKQFASPGLSRHQRRAVDEPSASGRPGSTDCVASSSAAMNGIKRRRNSCNTSGPTADERRVHSTGRRPTSVDVGCREPAAVGSPTVRLEPDCVWPSRCRDDESETRANTVCGRFVSEASRVSESVSNSSVRPSDELTSRTVDVASVERDVGENQAVDAGSRWEASRLTDGAPVTTDNSQVDLLPADRTSQRHLSTTGGASSVTSSIPVGIARAQLRHVEDCNQNHVITHGRRSHEKSTWQNVATKLDVDCKDNIRDMKMSTQGSDKCNINPANMSSSPGAAAEDAPDIKMNNRLHAVVPPFRSWIPHHTGNGSAMWYPLLPAPISPFATSDTPQSLSALYHGLGGCKVVPAPVSGGYIVIPDITWTDPLSHTRHFDRRSVRLTVDTCSPVVDNNVHTTESMAALDKQIKCEYLSPPVCDVTSSTSNRLQNPKWIKWETSPDMESHRPTKVTVKSRGTSPLVEHRDADVGGCVQTVDPPTVSSPAIVMDSSDRCTPQDSLPSHQSHPSSPAPVFACLPVPANVMDISTEAAVVKTELGSGLTVGCITKGEAELERSVEVLPKYIPAVGEVDHADEEVDAILNAKPSKQEDQLAETSNSASKVFKTELCHGYELERITPVDEELEPTGTDAYMQSSVPNLLHVIQPTISEIPAPNITLLPCSNAAATDSFLGLEMLSTIAFHQSSSLESTQTVSSSPEVPVQTVTAVSDQPARRFCLLDLPISQFIDEVAETDKQSTSTSPDVVSAGYNIPSLLCFNEENGDGLEPLSPAHIISHPPRQRSESVELRSGDVFTSLSVDVGPENMDAMELDMRMRLAELQVKYREKQRELARLQRRSSTERTSHNGRAARRKPSTPLRLTTARHRLSGSVIMSESHHDVECHSVESLDTRTLSPVMPVSLPKPVTPLVKEHTIVDSSSKAEKASRTVTEKVCCGTNGVNTTNGVCTGTKVEDKPKQAKKLSKSFVNKLTKGSKKQFSFYSFKKKNHSSTRNMSQKLEKKRQKTDKKKRPKPDKNQRHSADASKDGPGFYADEWYRRRSERIFLHEASAPPPVVTTAEKTSNNNCCSLTTKTSTSRVTSGKASVSAIPKNGGAIILSTPKSSSDTPVKLKKNVVDPVTLPPPPASHVPSVKSWDLSADLSSSSSDSESSTDTDDMPLSAYINRNHSALGRKSCILYRDDIVDGLRILFLKDGLFYEASVKEVVPRDIYSIVIDGERGSRPNYVALEDLLSRAKHIVQPTSKSDVPPGSRICAYWSQKFTGLHPGIVCDGRCDENEDEDEDDDDDDVISVEFDDGDSGRISLNCMRILPSDFPIQESAMSPLEMIGTRRRRTASTETGGAKKVTKPRHSTDDVLMTRNSRSVKTSWSTKRLQCEYACVSPTANSDTAILSSSPASTMDPKNAVPITAAKITERRKSDLTLTIKRKQSQELSDLSSSDDDESGSSSSSDEEERNVSNNNTCSSAVEASFRAKIKKIKKSYSDSSCSESERNEGMRLNHKSNGKSGKRKKSSSSSKEHARKRRHHDPSNSKIGSFLSVWQQWRWVGKCTQRPGMKGRARKLFYKAIQRGNVTLEVGECAVFISHDRNLQYIGRIISLWESWDGGMFVRVKWFYHPEETKGGKRLLELKGALYQSPHEDENEVQTISHKCEIMSYTNYKRYQSSQLSRLSSPTRDVYYLAGTYDPITHHVEFEPDVKLAF